MKNTDVLEAVKSRKMSPWQRMVVAVGLFLVLLDGYDISLTSFTSPFIAKEFNITSAELGIAMAGALVGMFLASITITPLGDKIGRRNLALLGAYILAIGMAISTFAPNVLVLAFGRLVTGAGISTLIAAIAVIFSEYSSRRAYPAIMAAYAAGMAGGTLVGATWVGPLVPQFGWRFAFEIGLASAVLGIILTHLVAPESLTFIAEGGKPRSLERYNKTLGRMGMEPVAELPVVEGGRVVKMPLSAVLAGNLRSVTLMAFAAYFLFMVTFYFTTNWAAKYMADVTRVPSDAATTMSWYGIGGIIGVVLWGVVVGRSNIYKLSFGVLVLAGICVGLFGMSAQTQTAPYMVIAAASFFLSAGTAAFYSIVPVLYPDRVRATGFGLVMGVGRFGGIVAPILGGIMFDAKINPPVIFGAFAIPIVVAAVVLLYLEKRAHRVHVGIDATSEEIEMAADGAGRPS